MAGRPSPYPEQNPCLPYHTCGLPAPNEPNKKSILTINTEASLLYGCLKEFFCVFLYIVIPNVANAAFCLAASNIFTNTSDSVKSLLILFSYATYLGALRMAYHYSAHMSPAVTVTLTLLEVFPKKKVALYVCSQFFGAFLATLCVYGFSNLNNTTANILLLSREQLFPTWAVIIGESLVGATVGSMLVIAMSSEENYYLKAKHSFWVTLPHYFIIGFLSLKFSMLDISVLDPVSGLGGQMALRFLSGSFFAGQGWFVFLIASAASTTGIMLGSSYYSDLLPEDPAFLKAELEKKVQAWTRFT